MYFFVDIKDQTITARPSLGAAAKVAIEKIGGVLPKGTDPVKTASALLGDRGLLLNLSGAFESIAESEGIAAQELATQYREALDTYHAK